MQHFRKQTLQVFAGRTHLTGDASPQKSSTLLKSYPKIASIV